jgi:hypothetical protein
MYLEALIKNIQKVIDIAGAIVSLGTSIFAKDTKAIGEDIDKPVKIWKS